ncbi:MAG: 1-acyl-sn-glycerol-3-phosphate acyltransferase [Polyangiaceae bacterium]
MLRVQMTLSMSHGGEESAVAEEVVGRIVARVLQREAGDRGHAIHEVVGETLFHERSRLEDASGPRADADNAFYKHVARRLARAEAGSDAALVREVVRHYTDEIRGHFDRRVYAVATRLLPVGLSALLNGLSPLHFLTRARDLPSIEKNVVLDGEIEKLQSLARVGTVILAPTHSSNLDSLLLGFAIFRMGLPPFSYGAGLNLFTNPLTSFFMNHLGAYTVDRSKTDPLYRSTLKEFATVLLERGHHNLFFPGGTRSRSGGVETRLKKGLLGTGIAAFKNNLRSKKPRPRIFVVPATATYPLVLEAKSLIVDFLERTGRGRYVRSVDEFNVVRRWVDFLSGLLRLRLRIPLVIGKPFDPFGNEVDASGASHDARGRLVDPSRYLVADGELVDDPARDAEYTSELASRLLQVYRADNVALPPAILAFALFDLLRRRSPGLDLYRLLRGVDPDARFPAAAVGAELSALVAEIRALARDGKIRVGAESVDPTVVVRRGLETFRTYHSVPVIDRQGEDFVMRDANLAFYYRNRLEGYGLRGSTPLIGPDP